MTGNAASRAEKAWKAGEGPAISRMGQAVVAPMPWACTRRLHGDELAEGISATGLLAGHGDRTRTLLTAA